MSSHEVHSYWITASGREGSAGRIDALFPYWSFTKTVWSICALKLAEAGALELDAVLPGTPYTLRQLLMHDSGLPDYGPLPAYGAAVAASQRPWSRRKMLDLALRDGMLFEPGKGWSYSNIGYMFVRELIEETTGNLIDQVVLSMISKPLGLCSIELAQTRDQFAKLHWPAAAGYDPGWVYHGCLIGTAKDAAQLLWHLFAGNLLSADMMRQMQHTRLVGGAIAGRPWTQCGYALGLMAGETANAGRALGHSGCGPFSVNAVYHFPDLADPLTIACFTDGADEGIAEWAALNVAAQG